MVDDQSQQGALDPVDALRMRWWLPIVGGIIGALLLGAGALVLPKHYSSAAVVQVVAPQTTNPDATVISRFVATQAGLVTADATVTQVGAQLGLTPAAVRAAVDVSDSADTSDELTVTATGDTAAKAQELAQTVVTTYVSASTTAGKAQLQSQIALLQTQLNNLAAQSATAPTALDRAAATTSFTNVQQQQQQLRVSLQTYTPPASVVQGAALPPGPSGIGPKSAGVVGLLVGMLAGIGLAFLLASRSELVTRPADIAQASRLPLLGVVPYSTRLLRKASVYRLQPREADGVAEAARALEVQLRPVLAEGRILLVTSPGRYDGKTTVAGQLATVIAGAGLRVLLVAADARSAVATPVPEGTAGLTDLLLGEPVAPVPTTTMNLEILPLGRHADRGVDLLRRPTLRQLLLPLSHYYNVVIIDGPALSVPESQTLAAAADHTLLVVGTHDARRSVIRRGLAPLRAQGSALAGVLVVDVEDKVRAEHSDYDTVAEEPWDDADTARQAGTIPPGPALTATPALATPALATPALAPPATALSGRHPRAMLHPQATHPQAALPDGQTVHPPDLLDESSGLWTPSVPHSGADRR